MSQWSAAGMSFVCLTLELIQLPLHARLTCASLFHVRNGVDIYLGAPARRQEAQRVSGRNQIRHTVSGGAALLIGTPLYPLYCQVSDTFRSVFRVIYWPVFQSNVFEFTHIAFLALAKPRLKSIASRESMIFHSRKHVWTARESSGGGVFYLTTSNAAHCTAWCRCDAVASFFQEFP